MERHYYTKNTDLAHERKQLEFQLRGQALRFTSDAGVFSKTQSILGRAYCSKRLKCQR